MGNYINEALLGANPLKSQQSEAKHLVEKWDKTGLLDGLNEDFKKSGMATLLENQARELISENSRTNPTGANDEEWSGVALPLVRRVFGEIVAQEFVSVQPMNLPSGLVFYLDFKYGTTKSGFKGTGDMDGENYDNITSIGGKTGPFNPSGSSAPYGQGGLYGAGRYGYSVPSSSVTLSALGDISVANNAKLATYADLNFDTDFSASFAGGNEGVAAGGILAKVSASFTGTSADLLSVRAWKISCSSVDGVGTGTKKVYPQFTKYNKSTGKLEWICGSSSTTLAEINGNTATWVVEYHKQPTEAARGDFEDTVGNANLDTLNIPEVDLQMNSTAIVAKTRKLKAVWTPELAQDLNAYHSVDAEAELTSMLSEYISMEIDLEILDMLINDATTTDYWSAVVGEDYDSSANSGTGGFVNNSSNAYAYTRYEWYQTLIGKIQKVSNEIHRLTLRGGANFVVCGPKIATILESIPGYNVATDGNKSQFAMGVAQAGAINNRFTVYKSPYMSENTILLGFRGSNFLETGAVYAPYVPLIMTPLVYDPSDFTPRKGVMTRYAKKMVRPEFYGKIYVKGLEQL